MLESDQIDKLRMLLAGGGWRDVMRPAVMKRASDCIKLGFNLPQERPERYKNMPEVEVIRHLQGQVETCEWLLAAFENEVKVADYNRLNEERSNGAAAGANHTQPADL